MATLYITDESKLLLDKLSAADRNRPLVDVMSFLIEERAKQLGIMPETTPSVQDSENIEVGAKCQE